MLLQPLTVSLVTDPVEAGPPRAAIGITNSSDAAGIEAVRLWQAHIDAGRIPCPARRSPESVANALRIREMERILGIRRGEIW